MRRRLARARGSSWAAPIWGDHRRGHRLSGPGHAGEQRAHRAAAVEPAERPCVEDSLALADPAGQLRSGAITDADIVFPVPDTPENSARTERLPLSRPNDHASKTRSRSRIELAS